MQATVDDRGRILIPQALRERFHLTPGSVVDVEATLAGVQILSRAARLEAQKEWLDRFLSGTQGAFRDSKIPPIDPREVKGIWEPRP